MRRQRYEYAKRMIKAMFHIIFSVKRMITLFLVNVKNEKYHI